MCEERKWYDSIETNDPVFNAHMEYYLKEMGVLYEWREVWNTNGFRYVRAYLTESEKETLSVYFE